MKMPGKTLTAAVFATFLLWGCSGPPATDLKPDAPAPAAAAPPPAAAPAAAPVERAKPASSPVNKPSRMEATRQPASPEPVANLPPAPPPAPAPAPVPQAAIPAPIPVPAPPPEPTTKQVSVPAGTQVYIRMIDSIESDKAHAGDTFRASLDRAIMVDNLTVVPRNVDVSVKLVDVQSAGKLSGTSQLKVQLDKIFINKKPYDVTTNAYLQAGSSEGKKAVRNVGVGAAVGGILGGILGGGKGAVIGAGAGGGGGAAVSKGEQIRIESEAQLVFKLENPLDVTLTLAPSSSSGSSKPMASGGPAQLAPPTDISPAQRSSTPSADSLSGTWTVGTDSLIAATMKLVLTQSGSGLQGSITNPAGGGGNVSIRGSVSGNFITFSVPQSGMAGAAPIQFNGAINGDSMEGTFTMQAASSPDYGSSPMGRGGRGGGRTSGRSGASTQGHWNAQRTGSPSR